MDIIAIQYYKTPLGELVLGSYAEELCLCDWRYRTMRTAVDKRICAGLYAVFEEKSSEVIEAAKLQLEEYFRGERITFDLPLKLVGTDFQRRVWQELLNIPYGKTETYLGLSRKLGDELAIRAVASTNGANALSIIIPCHRVIGSNGELTGYAGGVSTKKKLLQLEARQVPVQQGLFAWASESITN